MDKGVAIGLILGGTAVSLIVVLVLWRLIPAWAALVGVSLLGALIGVGAMLLQDDPGPADWVVALGLLISFTPVHCRLVFGRPGPPRETPRVVAAPRDGA